MSRFIPNLKMLLWANLIGILVSACTHLQAEKVFNKASWQQDYVELKNFTARTYANLDWMIETGRVDVRALDVETQSLLSAASNDEEGKKALEHFVSAFHDIHFRLERDKKSENSDFPITVGMTAESACEQMRFKEKSKNFSRIFSKDQKILQSTNGSFEYTTTRNRREKKIGFVRIASFLERNYLSLCKEKWKEMQTSISGECKRECQENLIAKYIANTLLKEFADVLDELNKQKITALVVDVTNNGGGTDWEGAVARMLTTKELICGRKGYIRHSHHKSRLGEESELRCDRSKIWDTPGISRSCPLVAFLKEESCAPGSDYKYKKGIYAGPLFFLADKGSASATEDLLARHADTKSALILGEKTCGAGCGYMNGGISTILTNSQLRVKISDCVRARANGANEVDGIAPDIPLNLSEKGNPELLKELIETVSKRP